MVIYNQREKLLFSNEKCNLFFISKETKNVCTLWSYFEMSCKLTKLTLLDGAAVRDITIFKIFKINTY